MNTNILFNKNMLPAQFWTSSTQLIVICTHSGRCTFQMCTISEEMSRSATNGSVCILHSPEGAVNYDRTKREYAFLCKAFVASHEYGKDTSPGVLTVENLKVLVTVKKRTMFSRIRNRAVSAWRRLRRKSQIRDYTLEVCFTSSPSHSLLKVVLHKIKAEDVLLHFGLLPQI